jgi:hypothetical protein
LQNKGWNQKSEKQQTHTKHRKGTNKVVDFLSIRERKTTYISCMRNLRQSWFFPTSCIMGCGFEVFLEIKTRSFLPSVKDAQSHSFAKLSALSLNLIFWQPQNL